MVGRYIVIGAGGVGVALAVGLREAGLEAVLVSRGASYERIRETGLRYTRAGAHGGEEQRLDVETVASAEEVVLRDDDALVLAVKSQDVEAALRLWAEQPVRGGDGTSATAGERLTLITLQNGLDAPRAALRRFDTVLAGVALVAASHVSAGTVEIRNAPKLGQLILGAYPTAEAAPEAAARLAAVAADLRAAEWLVQEADEPQRWLAWKLLLSIAFPIEVLEGTAEEEDELRERIVGEAREVLLSSGHAFADPVAELDYDASLARVEHPEDEPVRGLSTWQSFARGSGSEVDYLNGEIALRARLQGLEAPYNVAIQRVLAAAALAGEAPGTRTVGEVLRAAAGRQPEPKFTEPTDLTEKTEISAVEGALV